jgi:DNA (cytosine-5)-methyltransferase 1
MWPQAIRAVREVRPRAFLFENVRGLLRASFADYLRYIVLHLKRPEATKREGESWHDHLRRLEKATKQRRWYDLCYRVQVQGVDAADYGAAQNRKRVIIVGIRHDLTAEFQFPKPTHSNEALDWDQFQTGVYWERHRVPRRERPISPVEIPSLVRSPLKPWQTVRDAIHDLREPMPGKLLVANHKYQAGARAYVGHTGSPLDQPAKALKAGDHGVPGGENMLRKPDGSVRYFTVREAARLQGFPDQFVFPMDVPWSEAMRQLGNAVPTQLATSVGRTIRETLRNANNKEAVAA